MRIGERLLLLLNSVRNRFQAGTYPAERIILLLPKCLQSGECEVRLKGNLLLCRRCGRCKLKPLRDLAESLGVGSLIATGGRDAARRAREDGIDVVVAVACERELAEGIRAVFPKRVVPLPISWPHGECNDTDVDVEQVRQALLRHIRRQDPDGRSDQ